MQLEIISKKQNNYPQRLEQLHEPPKELKSQGAKLQEQLKQPVLGIVGSRKVTVYGRQITERFAESAARAGVCIVSGLAIGVDSIAHAAALNAKGKTIAVLPSGLKAIYPAMHRGLAKQILESCGTLLSEFDDYFMPRRESFIQRNRIIAGLSDALLVTEAAERSGSLYTANFAMEIGRPVLAVPGNITSPTSSGTNNLIKSGAISVTSEQDIFDALKIITKSPSEKVSLLGDNEHETNLLELLRGGASAGDELLAKSEMEIGIFQQTLTMLEIKGAISALGNNHWKLK
ncbi:DNA-processing protein DprA [Candidatus Parcubacteria bacterium]|nr:DNA-processing protein DprA [Candidatus Parcubacteria bacterium]